MLFEAGKAFGAFHTEHPTMADGCCLIDGMAQCARLAKANKNVIAPAVEKVLGKFFADPKRPHITPLEDQYLRIAILTHLLRMIKRSDGSLDRFILQMICPTLKLCPVKGNPLTIGEWAVAEDTDPGILRTGLKMWIDRMAERETDTDFLFAYGTASFFDADVCVYFLDTKKNEWRHHRLNETRAAYTCLLKHRPANGKDTARWTNAHYTVILLEQIGVDKLREIRKTIKGFTLLDDVSYEQTTQLFQMELEALYTKEVCDMFAPDIEVGLRRKFVRWPSDRTRPLSEQLQGVVWDSPASKTFFRRWAKDQVDYEVFTARG